MQIERLGDPDISLVRPGSHDEIVCIVHHISKAVKQRAAVEITGADAHIRIGGIHFSASGAQQSGILPRTAAGFQDLRCMQLQLLQKPAIRFVPGCDQTDLKPVSGHLPAPEHRLEQLRRGRSVSDDGDLQRARMIAVRYPCLRKAGFVFQQRIKQRYAAHQILRHGFMMIDDADDQIGSLHLASALHICNHLLCADAGGKDIAADLHCGLLQRLCAARRAADQVGNPAFAQQLVQRADVILLFVVHKEIAQEGRSLQIQVQQILPQTDGADRLRLLDQLCAGLLLLVYIGIGENKQRRDPRLHPPKPSAAYAGAAVCSEPEFLQLHIVALLFVRLFFVNEILCKAERCFIQLRKHIFRPSAAEKAQTDPGKHIGRDQPSVHFGEKATPAPVLLQQQFSGRDEQRVARIKTERLKRRNQSDRDLFNPVQIVQKRKFGHLAHADARQLPRMANDPVSAEKQCRKHDQDGASEQESPFHTGRSVDGVDHHDIQKQNREYRDS